MPDINTSSNVKSKYLERDKSFNIQRHLNQLEKEEKSGLKGIEIREKSKELGKDDFLKILITQLSQQDPTNPMKDQDFIAQMAQFSGLEQMKNISSGISRMESKQAYSIVGKIVSGPDMVTGDDVVGIAGAIFFDAEGKTYARVNGRTVDIEKINLISDPNIMDDSKTTKQAINPNPNSNANTSSKPHSNANPNFKPQSGTNPESNLQPKTDSIKDSNSKTSAYQNANIIPGEEIPGYQIKRNALNGGLKNNPYDDQVFIENDER